MGACCSAYARSPNPITDEPINLKNNPWDRELLERENPDAIPKYYKDKDARAATERRKKARLKREALVLKAAKKKLKGSLSKSRNGKVTEENAASNQGRNSRKPIDDVVVDDQPEGGGSCGASLDGRAVSWAPSPSPSV